MLLHCGRDERPRPAPHASTKKEREAAASFQRQRLTEGGLAQSLVLGRNDGRLWRTPPRGVTVVVPFFFP